MSDMLASAPTDVGGSSATDVEPKAEFMGRLEELAKGFCLHGEPEFPLPLRKCF